jgi:hypothetical protein
LSCDVADSERFWIPNEHRPLGLIASGRLGQLTRHLSILAPILLENTIKFTDSDPLFPFDVAIRVKDIAPVNTVAVSGHKVSSERVISGAGGPARWT